MARAFLNGTGSILNWYDAIKKCHVHFSSRSVRCRTYAPPCGATVCVMVCNSHCACGRLHLHRLICCVRRGATLARTLRLVRTLFRRERAGSLGRRRGAGARIRIHRIQRPAAGVGDGGGVGDGVADGVGDGVGEPDASSTAGCAGGGASLGS